MSKTEIIDVGVRQRILWVGSQAYPLHNIARAQTVKLVPRRGPAVTGFIKALLGWGILGGAGVVGLQFADMPKADANKLAVYVVLAVTALVGFSAIRAVVRLFRRTLYALVIETAGSPQTAVVSPDERLLNGLVHQIMYAINNPQAEFHLQLHNHITGNTFNNYGSNSVGVATR